MLGRRRSVAPRHGGVGGAPERRSRGVGPAAVPRLARARRRAAGAVLVAAIALVGGAAPAAADPPQPTDYRSTVTGLEAVPVEGAAPADPAAEADTDVTDVEAVIVGGDAFLELTVAPGHEVVVTGYGEEPYLRFLPDGTVERNRWSPATYLNDDRQGEVDVPAEADAASEPEWEAVAADGRYAWHDHRIHWMGGSPPPGIGPGEKVQNWAVSLTLDGTAVAVQGVLVRADDISPLPWIMLAVVGGGICLLLGRRHALPVAVLGVLVAASGALVVGRGQYGVAPAGSGTEPLLVAVPALGLAAAVAAAIALVLRRRGIAATATLGAAAAVTGWAVLRLSVLWTPVLPTELSASVDRAITALALGLAVASAFLVVWRGQLSFVRLDELELAEPGPGPGAPTATPTGGN
jgi:hypothetical protein